MEKSQPDDLEKIDGMKAAATLASTVSNIYEFLKDPSLKNFGPVDISQLEERDKVFFKKLLSLASVDPDILRRVFIMRHKLNNQIKLTEPEAKELLEVLNAQSFPLTGLDVSGYTFGKIYMGNAVIGGDCNFSDVTVGDLDQNNMFVGGSNFQERMHVKGDNWQSALKVADDNYQSKMRVDGINEQSTMEIKGNNYQTNIQIGVSNRQDHMSIGKTNNQSGSVIGKNNGQFSAKIGELNLQVHMNVSGNNRQGKLVARTNYQHGMKVKGDDSRPQNADKKS